MHSHTISYVPTIAVKEILVQTNIEGRRGKWIAAMLEYDLEIKPTNLINDKVFLSSWLNLICMH